MRRTRIRYKKLFFCLLLLAALVYGIGWAVVTAFTQWRMPTATTGEEPTEYYLFLGLGKEPPDEAAAIWLMAYNQKIQEMYFIALPECTRISAENEPILLLGSEYKNGSAERLISSVENLLHIRIKHYAVFDETTFANLIGNGNSLEMYVERDMRHQDGSGRPDIALRQGVQTLDGEAAYAYMRFLENPEDEIGRIRREQRLIKSFLAAQKGNSKLHNRFTLQFDWSPLATDISAADAGALAAALTTMPAENIHFTILPGKFNTVETTRVWDINPVELQSAIGAVLGQDAEKGK